MWQYIILFISAVLFFSFVYAGVLLFGLLSCYSAYAPMWGEMWPSLNRFNVWSVVTIFSALLMVPIILTQGEGSPWQFLGFLAPASILLVGASPDYQTDKFQWWIHQIGAWSAVGFCIGWIIAVPKLLWVVIPFALAAVGLSVWKKGTWMFWAEMVVYLTIYTVLFINV